MLCSSPLFTKLKKQIHNHDEEINKPNVIAVPFRRPTIVPVIPPVIVKPLIAPETYSNCVIDTRSILNNTSPPTINNQTPMSKSVLNLRGLIPTDIKTNAASLTIMRNKSLVLSGSTVFIKQPPVCGPPPYRFTNEPTARIKRNCNIPKVINT